jgi:MFS family permease
VEPEEDEPSIVNLEDIQDLTMTNLRFYIMLLASFIIFANNYAFSNPDSISNQIKDHYKIADKEYNEFQAFYSFPSILFCIPAGILIDVKGIRFAIMIFSAFSLVGLFLFAVSASLQDLTTALIGRAVYGIGAECQNVWFATIVSIWFHHGEVAFATAALSSFGKGGSLVSSLVGPLTFKAWGGIEGGFWLSFLFNSIAVVVALVIN